MGNRYVLKSKEKGLVEDATYPKYPLYTSCNWRAKVFESKEDAASAKLNIENNTNDRIIICLQDEYRNAIELK